ncbi:MAG TPA: hypothetical protein EYH34_13555 [Planctomycetes bacterium]|nr:hypothetical protein [Planctomycetota bacterium]
MAKRFVRVDLSDVARDFRPIAVEPGVPLLDRSSANSTILFKWLGGMVAEPEWEGESVSFYVRDDHGGRLEDVQPQPASDEDLKGPLKDEVEVLRQRIAKAKPETSTERAVYKILTEQFNNVLENEHRTDRPNYFFKYRDAAGRWRLVWCWGYQRVDQEPGQTVICTASQCNLLFVRRKGQTPKCPSCSASLVPKRAKKRPKRRRLLMPLLMVIGVAVLLWWLFNRNRLVAEPAGWQGPVGGRVAFSVTTPGIFGFFRREVTAQTTVIVDDPQLARVDHAGRIVAQNPGTTQVHFHWGSKHAAVSFRVLAPQNPESIRIEPRPLELAVGSTMRLKLVGRYPDQEVDLTESAEWYPKNDGVIYALAGFVQGLGAGRSEVRARYRAGPGADYLEATAAVEVRASPFEKLELAVDPQPVPVGRISRLVVDATAADGRTYSVLDSSELDLVIDPPWLASVRRGAIHGRHPGRGHIEATLGSLTARVELEVRPAAGADELMVRPERLALAVGEVARLAVRAPAGAPVRITSSAPAVLEVRADQSLVGRGVGEATVRVEQGEQVRQVQVRVAKSQPRAISIVPGLVGVPVDGDVQIALRAYTEEGRSFELDPMLVGCERSPPLAAATFVRGDMRLHGVAPTEDDSPGRLALAFGNLKAQAPVHVVPAPLRLVLTPPGPIELPVGQAFGPKAWARYPAGHTVGLLPERLQWHSQAAPEAAGGLELRGGKVMALKAEAGPLSVWASYSGRQSNRVEFRSVKAARVRLALDVDRTLRLAGEPGRVILMGSGPRGDVELVPELARFRSSDTSVLEINAQTGAFRAMAPGKVEVRATHAASDHEALVKLRVIDPAKARLLFDPDSVHVAVDEKATVRLFLEGEDSEGVHRDRMVGPGVRYSLGQAGAISWYPPELVGLRPCAPFELGASYFPYLERPAVARVEVLSAEKASALRVVPSQMGLAPGQPLALAVQEQLPGSRAWREVRPEAIRWTVSNRLVWQPPADGLRPVVMVPPGTSGTFRVTASYRGQKAEATIETRQPALDPADTSVQLVVRREPEGRYLPVGRRQRYTVWLSRGNEQEPAVGVRWPQEFENEYVRWRAPVLTAKRAGYQQWLEAEAGGRTVRFFTETIDPLAPSATPPPRKEPDVELVILSDQGSSIQVPVGAAFDDFRIEARYPDGFTRIVTKKATMRASQPAAEAPVAFSAGRIVGVRPGKSVVEADFEGASTAQGLEVTVTEQLEVDRIVVAAPPEILVGETVPLEVTGFKDGKSVGKISGLSGLRFRSDNPQRVRVQGPSVTGVAVGEAAVTARWGGVQSQPVTVRVSDTVGQQLVVDEPTIWMRVGETRWIGTDFSVRRGQTDLSRQVRVYSSLPQVVAYDAEAHSLHALQVGQSVITFTAGRQMAQMAVEVLPSRLTGGRVVVEPAVSTLVPGQAVDLRVFLLTDQGDRIDRTGLAIFSSSAENVVVTERNRACAVGPGTAQVTVTLAEADQPATAAVEVIDGPIEEVVIDPAQLAMSVGDVRQITVLGRAATGTYPLFRQDDLEITAGGRKPEAIRIQQDQSVAAESPGEAEVVVRWAGRLTRSVPVTVSDDPLTDLAIDPPTAAIHPGQALVYQVTAVRGGQRRVLGPADGLRLMVTQPDVARPAGETTAVVATAPGRTSVVAQVGSAQAEAVLDVLPGDGPIGVGRIEGAGQLVYGPDGYVYGPDGVVVYGPDDLVYGPEGVVYGPDGEIIYSPGGTRIYRPGYGRIGYDTWWTGPGYVDQRSTVFAPPGAPVAGLRFVPQVIRMDAASPGSEVRVYEVLGDGTLGREVTADPDLEFNVVGEVARIEREGSRARLVPLSPGTTRIGARLGDPPLFADPELMVQVGRFGVGAVTLEVVPSSLDLSIGESAGLERVLVHPGGGQAPFEVQYTIQAPPGQGVIGVDGQGRIQGLAPGRSYVSVAVAAPGKPYDGLQGVVPVTVLEPGSLWLEPSEVSLKVGQLTPPFAVMARDRGGLVRRLPARLESMDRNVLVADARAPDRFLARGLGRTQVRAVAGGRQLFADVEVAGERFVEVRPTLIKGATDFAVSLEVRAAGSEGPLEYRVYPAGQTPPEAWVDAVSEEAGQRAVLQSPRLPYGPPTATYSLVLEARSKTNGTVQTYPFTFRLEPEIVTENP